jgi:hypothetical protein
MILVLTPAPARLPLFTIPPRCPLTNTLQSTWSGVVASLLLASIVTGIGLLLTALCIPIYTEHFYARKYFVTKTFDAAHTRVHLLPNKRYLPVEPPHFAVAPFLFPWQLLVRTWRLYAAAVRNSWATLRGPSSLLQHVSLDAHMTEVYLQLCFAFFVVCFILCIPVSLVNALSGGEYPDPLYRLATSRLSQRDPRLWVQFGALALSTFALLGLLHVGYREYERQRIRWMAVLAPSSFTIMLTGLPYKGACAIRARVCAQRAGAARMRSL